MYVKILSKVCTTDQITQFHIEKQKAPHRERGCPPSPPPPPNRSLRSFGLRRFAPLHNYFSLQTHPLLEKPGDATDYGYQINFTGINICLQVLKHHIRMIGGL